MKTQRFYKLANPTGWDFRTHNTINYRENIGKTVVVPTFRKSRKKSEYELCTNLVLHASEKPLQCFIGASIPCSAYIVEGTPKVKSTEKCGFSHLTVIEEIPQDKLADLFGFDYPQVANPIHPLKLSPVPITDVELLLLQNWASVLDSVGASVWDSVRDSVRDSVWASVWASVWDSVRDSVRDSVWDSVGASVGDSVGASVLDSVGASVLDSVGASVWDSVLASVGASVGAYIGSLFPKITTWKYAPTNIQGYPYQPCVDLWKKGIVPSFDGKTYRLHTNIDARIAYEITADKLKKLSFHKEKKTGEIE